MQRKIYLGGQIGFAWDFMANVFETNNEGYRQTAEMIEVKFDKLILSEFDKLYHDVGFMWLHTAVVNNKITNNQKSRVRGLHASIPLVGILTPKGEYIVACSMYDFVNLYKQTTLLF